MEGYILKTNISFYVIQSLGVWRILNIRRNGHHFQEAVVTAVSILELLGEVYQLGHWLCKVVDI